MQWRRSHAEILICSKGANGAKAPQPRPSILAVVVRIKGERGESIFSNTFSLRTTKKEPASSDSVSSKGTHTIRSAHESTTGNGDGGNGSGDCGDGASDDGDNGNGGNDNGDCGNGQRRQRRRQR